MKRLLLATLVAGVLCGLIATQVSAAVVISLLPASQVVPLGSNATLDIMVDSGGAALAALGVNIQFDPAALEVVDTSAGNFAVYWIIQGPAAIKDYSGLGGSFVFSDHTAMQVFSGEIYNEHFVMSGTPAPASGKFGQVTFKTLPGILGTGGRTDVIVSTVEKLGSYHTVAFDVDYATELPLELHGAEIVVPEPSTMLLLGSGVLGLVAIARKRR
jgi:hypothetical protein